MKHVDAPPQAAESLPRDADTIAADFLHIEQALKTLSIAEASPTKSSELDAEIRALREQLGRHFTLEMEVDIRAKTAEGGTPSSGYRPFLEERLETLSMQLADALRQRFYSEAILPFIENFDFSNYYDAFERDLGALFREYRYGEHTFRYEAGSLTPSQIMDLKRRSTRKLNALNEKRFQKRTKQEEDALEEHHALFVDGRLIPLSGITLIGGVHGDEFSGPDALKEGIQKLRTTPLNVPVHVEPEFNQEGLKAGTREMGDLDLNRSLPMGTLAAKMKKEKINQIPEGSYVVDFHNCRGDTPPFGITCSFSEDNIALAQELGLDMLIVCDEKLMSGSVLSDAIKQRKADGLVIETSAARKESKMEVQRIVAKMLSLASAAAGKRVESQIGVKSVERNEAMRLYHAIAVPELPEKDENYYQVLNGTAVKFVRLEKQGRAFKQIPLTAREREMFEKGGLN